MRRISFVFICLFLSSIVRADDYGPRAFAGGAFTAIVSAFEPEINTVLEQLKSSGEGSIERTVSYRGVRYHVGQYRGQPVLVFATGISITNAAMTTQMALDYFPVERVVFMGICGGINPEWKPGDVVVPERWFYHDETIYANPHPSVETEHQLPEYYEVYIDTHTARKVLKPYLPDYTNFDFIYPSEVMISQQGQERPQLTPYFAASDGLLEAARRAAIQLPTQMLGDRKIRFSVGGHGVSGSVFLDNRDYRDWVRRVYRAEVVDMESAAVGHVCTVNGVDWIIIRAVSDLAGGQDGINELEQYKISASAFGTALLFGVLDQLAPAAKP